MGYARGRAATSMALAVTLAAAVTAVVVLRGATPADAADVRGLFTEVHQGDGGDLWYHSVDEGFPNAVFGGSFRYVAGGGFRPSVAVGPAGVVATHQRGTGVGELVVVPGQRLSSDGKITWFADQTVATAGANPSIAMNDHGVVVLCYDKGSNQLFYRVGQLEGGHVDWAAEQVLDGAFGISPSVAINELGQVFVAYTGAMGLGHFTGTLSGGTIVRSTARPTSGLNSLNGTTASVTVTGNIVVEVGAENDADLWYRVGRFTNNGVNFGVNFLSEGYYDRGLNPSIAIDPINRRILEVHEGGDGTLWTHPGALNDTLDNINWGTQWHYDWGAQPAIAG